MLDTLIVGIPVLYTTYLVVRLVSGLVSWKERTFSSVLTVDRTPVTLENEPSIQEPIETCSRYLDLTPVHEYRMMVRVADLLISSLEKEHEVVSKEHEQPLVDYSGMTVKELESIAKGAGLLKRVRVNGKTRRQNKTELIAVLKEHDLIPVP